MSIISDAPPVGNFTIAMDRWTAPYWTAATEERLVVPKCNACGDFRWPPGPFCPNCRTQEVEWVAPGPAKVFSYTIVSEGSAEKPPTRTYVPALIYFPDAPGVRITAAIVDTPVDVVQIDADVEVAWSQAENCKIPVFRIRPKVVQS